jgi:hypothetical protein
VTYRLTALSAGAVGELETFEARFEALMCHWERAIAAAPFHNRPHQAQDSCLRPNLRLMALLSSRARRAGRRRSRRR